MKIAAWILGGAILLGQAAQDAAAQPGGTGAGEGKAETPAVRQEEVSFSFERAGMAVPRYKVTVREDGSGRYEADEAEASAGNQSNSAVRYAGGKHINQQITLSAATTAKVFKLARSLSRFDIACASKAKNIADTGKKTLSYVGPDGRGTSCIYNYSEEKNVTVLTDMFLAIAFTLDEGRKLEFLHRYDRLGLDAEMITLAHEVDEGRAMELGTIAPTLDVIASDTALIQRVRLRAAKLLERSKDQK